MKFNTIVSRVEVEVYGLIINIMQNIIQNIEQRKTFRLVLVR